MKSYETFPKYVVLKDILEEMDSALVAYSGGVDSTFLLAVASAALKDKVVAVTAISPIRSEIDLKNSRKVTHRLGVKHVIINSSELDNENIKNNAVDRCYFCKKDIFRKMLTLAKGYGLKRVCEASNVDDANEYRPGEKAVRELGIASPLKEAGFTKKDIRSVSKEMDLETWDAPSRSCLLTRFPYGSRIEITELERVKKAEDTLQGLGFKQTRVRVYGDLARIEIPHEDIGKLLEEKISGKVIAKLKALGYNYVTLDLEGYRTGSMDINIDPGSRPAASPGIAQKVIWKKQN
ncbi:MAG: ATP-dependent sacrificial sulfur transferase LarE [Candidatus Omnitrophota bacterium]